MAGVIPPSRTSSMRRKKKLRERKQRPCTKWLILNAVCLTINVSLMVALFIFHARWAPDEAANNFVHDTRLKGKNKILALLRGRIKDDNQQKQPQQEAEKKSSPEHNDGNDVGAPGKADKSVIKQESSSKSYELPTSPHNSPNDPNYDLSQQQYHIIFSTGCSDKQHWQSYMLYYSIISSGQQGHVTRIASGCNETEAQQLQQIHQEQVEPMGEGRFHLHLTPEFGEGFHYNNKPYGVHHWMEAILGYSADHPSTDHDHTILFLLDPDQVIMRPFVNDFKDHEIWRPRTSYPLVTRIQHGYPMAAEYGYGNQWYHKTNITKIAPDSPVAKLSKADIDENYHAGPPYTATARDFYQIVSQWRTFAQPVHEQYPYLLSEMFAYSLAAAHLKLPHQLARSFMVSDWKEPGLDLVTGSDQVSSSQMCRDVPTEFKPHVLHYCQRLQLGKYTMSKHRLPPTFVGNKESCEMPLLLEPPDDAALQFDYYVDIVTGKRHDIRDNTNGAFTKQQKINQQTFLLCEELKAFNLGATYYKEHHCPEDKRNMEKSLKFFDSLELTAAEKQQQGEMA